ncbi:MAG: hypothetical protein JNL57_02145 [Bacteroidetes bacterium]|nr:hypothetical protein [Bacteroidota bacterium]
MRKFPAIWFPLLFLLSCGRGAESGLRENTAPDTLSTPKITVLSALADSLKPRVRALDTLPAPVTVNIPERAGLFSSLSPNPDRSLNIHPSPLLFPLPAVQNEKGEILKDSTGKPRIAGNGGISHFSHFTTGEGLPQDEITCSITDKTGNLWFGTWNKGITRYDGKAFTTYTTAHGLASDHVSAILQDSKGNLWIATYGGGVSQYDGKGFSTLNTSHGLSNNEVFSLLEDRAGNLWFGTWGAGISRYDGKSFTQLRFRELMGDDAVVSIYEDKAGNLWFGTMSGGVNRYEPPVAGKPEKITNFTESDGLVANAVSCMAEDNAGNIWFGTDGGGASRYNGKTFTHFTTAHGLASNQIRCLHKDQEGKLWFGTWGGGISCLNGSAFVSYSTAQGLTNNYIRSFTEDKAGKLWIGTWGGGVDRYEGPAFTRFTQPQALALDGVQSLLEDKNGKLWLGTEDGGLSCFDGKSFTQYTTAQGLPKNNIYALAEDKAGGLWLGTWDGGVCRFDGKQLTTYTLAQGLGNDVIVSILQDKAGNLWFGTWGGGVTRFDGKTMTRYSTIQGLGSDYVQCMQEDRSGNLWFGTWGDGVTRYDGKTFATFTTAQGLAHNKVQSILEDKAGNLWFGTEKGISCLRPEEQQKMMELTLREKTQKNPVKRWFRNFSITDGLPSAYVLQLVQLPDGKIAVGTESGIALFQPTPDAGKLTGLEMYNRSSGYPVKLVNRGHKAMCVTRKGMLWTGTGAENTGLVRLDYAATGRQPARPEVVIQHIRIMDEPICWYNLLTNAKRKTAKDSSTARLQEMLAYGKILSPAEKDSLLNRWKGIEVTGLRPFYPVPGHFTLPYHLNKVSFDFAAVETTAPMQMKYQYMLEGYDKDWNPVTMASHAEFGNIPEGRYTFKVKALGPDGNWTAPVSYAFRVMPPWYRSWWAYVLYVVVPLAFLFFFIRWRERNLRAEKEKLERTVEERTREVVEQKNEAETQRKRSDELLLNILPEEVAEELKAKGSADAKQFDEVTVLFTDFKDFTQISEKMTPNELVDELNTFFKAFDTIVTQYKIEKIKTIGDSYMCVGGLPTASESHAEDVVRAGLAIQQFVEEHSKERVKLGKDPLLIRIGIHSGPVIAGIVGIKKYAYDIWGDTVNTASRMESSGEAGRVNISETTYLLVKDKFKCTPRGKIMAKHKGEMEMYFVEAGI